MKPWRRAILDMHASALCCVGGGLRAVTIAMLNARCYPSRPLIIPLQMGLSAAFSL